MNSRKIGWLILFHLWVVICFGQDTGQKELRLLYHKKWEQQLKKKPKDQKKWQEFELFAYMFARYADPAEKTLPLVFNVLETSSSRKIDMNLVTNQIQILNDAFAGKYENRENRFKDKMAGDSKIRFCYGSPVGNKIEIQYKSFGGQISVEQLASISDKKTGIEGAKKDEYINIWIVDLPDKMGGFALLPDVDAAMDGIYIDPDYFGMNFLKKDYSQGKTLIHLMGQYLGLKPLWADLDCLDDGIEDTPVHNAPNYGCYPKGHITLCSGNEEEMIGNFMDAGYDECATMFTKGQVAKMHANLSEKGYRNNLKEGRKICEVPVVEESLTERSNFEVSLEIIPNPMDGKAEIRFTIEQPEEVQIMVYTTTSALIFQTRIQDLGERSGHTMIDISGFPKGNYIVELKSKSYVIAKPFVKI